MNPYLEHEDAWHNFHEQFPAAAVEMLVPQVGLGYFVKVDEHVYIHEMPEDRRRLWGRADVFLGRTSSQQAPSAMLTAPRQVLLPAVEHVGLSYVEIRDPRNRRLVTVIELLSPSNKKFCQEPLQYLNKRAEILASSTHFIEIDLLRGWQRMPLAEEVACDYCVMVSRANQRPRADFWPIALRERLPVVPIPLGEGDPEPQLDLQAILHRLHDSCGYARFIYESEPEPALSSADAAWARSLIPPEAGRGST